MVRKLLLTCIATSTITQCTTATSSLSWGGDYKHGTLLFTESIDRAMLFNKIPQGKFPTAIIRDALVGYLDVIPEQFSLYRTFRSVTSPSQVAFSKDGSQLAIGYHDSSIGLWSSASGGFLHALWDLNASPVVSLAFSPDSKLLASGHYFDNVRLWDTKSQNLLHTFNESTRSAEAVAFNPAGTLLATGSDGGIVRVWDVTSRQLLRALIGGDTGVKSLAFSPDGTQLASGHKDGDLRIWDTASGSIIHSLIGHANTISALAFSPDGTKLASGSFDTTVQVWNLASGRLIRRLVGRDRVLAVMFIQDGIQFASDNGSIHVWDSTSDHVSLILGKQPQEHQVAAFSPDGTQLASSSAPNTVRLWLDYTKVLTEYFKKIDETTGYEQLLFALVVARAKEKNKPLDLTKLANYINTQLGGTEEQPVTNKEELIKIFLSMPPLVRGAFMRIFDLHMPMREYTKRAREGDDGGDEPAASASKQRLNEEE